MADLAFTAGRDDEWDAFVHGVRGGSPVQTSRWEDVKGIGGWRAARVAVRRDGEIVAGAQLLLRDLPVVGALAYAPRAPLVAGGPADDARVLDAIDALCRRERVAYLKLQPPDGRGDLEAVLRDRGYVRSDLEAAPTATTRVDVTRDDDALLAAMRTMTRGNVRKSLRRGLVVAEGATEDLAAFHAIVEATAARQDFHAYPYAYYRAMWDAFCGDDHAALLLVRDGDEIVSAALLLAYGDTVVYKMGGWAGGAPEKRPNEAMHWAGIHWARDHGYRWYDFEGLKPAAARAALAGETVQGIDGFKLGWGGEVALFPPAYDRSPRRALAPAVRLAAPRLDSVRGVAHRLLGRGA